MAKLVTQAQTYTILRNLGWRIRTVNEGTQVVRNFQRGWNLGPALEVDGLVGPKTSQALLESYANHKAGRGDASPHFSFVEFRCKCGARYDACQRIWVVRGLLESLEGYRARLDGPVRITSGCRCVGHNNSIQYAVPGSQHVRGTAADIHSPVTVNRVAGWHLFAGLGYAGSSSQVRHVDRRDLSTGSASRTRPTIWRYSQW